MKATWNGVYPAITTKFHPDDSIDFLAFEKNLDAQLDAGVEGIILGGSLGEASTLSDEEKFELLKFTIEWSKNRIPIVLNIAEQRTDIAVKMAQDAENAGAGGIMILPPLKYKADDHETVEYFKAVANATNLPVMIYNNPIDYKIMVTLEMFEELAECSNINAVKESTRDTTNVTRLKNRFGDRFKILCGVDTLAIESLVMGADGWVAGLVAGFPRETVAIFKMVKSGRTDEAVALFRWFLPLLELDIHPKLVQYIKLAEQQAGMGTEHVRAPRLPLQGEERERILKIIDDALAIRPELPDYLTY